jgi:predicted transcriptional regulator
MNEFQLIEYEIESNLIDNNFHLLKLKKILKFFKISELIKSFPSFSIIKNDISQISKPNEMAYCLSLDTTLENALEAMKMINVIELPYVDEKNQVTGLLNIKEICK